MTVDSHKADEGVASLRVHHAASFKLHASVKDTYGDLLSTRHKGLHIVWHQTYITTKPETCKTYIQTGPFNIHSCKVSVLSRDLWLFSSRK